MSLTLIQKSVYFCNAHVLLTIDEAMDSCFRTTETKAGKAKLISKDAGHVFSSPQNSIFYLSLIALSKLLSNSHCVESISLYKDYKKFLEELVQEGSPLVTEVVKNEFKGFRSKPICKDSVLERCHPYSCRYFEDVFRQQRG